MNKEERNLKIIELYNSGKLVTEVARCYSISTRTVDRILHKNNVIKRTMSDVRQIFYLKDISISDKLTENINGWLLGDGCLPKTDTKQTCFLFSTQHKEYAEYVRNLFLQDNISASIYGCFNKKYEKTYYSVRAVSTLQFKDLYYKWYGQNNTKCVPDDIILSPTTIKNWIMDDDGRNTRNDALIFHTNGFTKENCKMLLEKIKRIVSDHISIIKGPRIYLNRKSTNDLLKYIGACNVDVFKYKFYIGEKK